MDLLFSNLLSWGQRLEIDGKTVRFIELSVSFHVKHSGTIIQVEGKIQKLTAKLLQKELPDEVSVIFGTPKPTPEMRIGSCVYEKMKVTLKNFCSVNFVPDGDVIEFEFTSPNYEVYAQGDNS